MACNGLKQAFSSRPETDIGSQQREHQIPATRLGGQEQGPGPLALQKKNSHKDEGSETSEMIIGRKNYSMGATMQASSPWPCNLSFSWATEVLSAQCHPCQQEYLEKQKSHLKQASFPNWNKNCLPTTPQTLPPCTPSPLLHRFYRLLPPKAGSHQGLKTKVLLPLILQKLQFLRNKLRMVDKGSFQMT